MKILKLTEDVKAEYYAWIFGIISSLLGIISVLCFFFIDYRYVFIVIILIYIMIIMLEIKSKIYSIVNIFFFLLYFILFLQYLVFGFEIFLFIIYIIAVGIILLFLLSSLFFIHPSVSYDKSYKSNYHNVITTLWILGGIIIICINFFIKNYYSIYITVMLFIMLVLLNLYLNILGVYPFIKYKAKKKFKISNNDIFIDQYSVKNATHAILINTFIKNQFSDYDINNSDGVFYVYIEKNSQIEIVATLSYNFNFPIKITDHTVLYNNNPKNQFIYLDNLIISPQWKYFPLLILYLMINSIEFAIKSKMDAILLCSVPSRIKMFEGVGFELFSDANIFYSNHNTNLTLSPMILNLREYIIKVSPEDLIAQEYYQYSNKHLFEYCFKTTYLINILRPWKNKSFNLPLDYFLKDIKFRGAYE